MDSRTHPATGGGSTLADTRCRNCGSHVSRQFVRVFGTDDNELYGCLDCSTARNLRQGSGTRL